MRDLKKAIEKIRSVLKNEGLFNQKEEDACFILQKAISQVKENVSEKKDRTSFHHPKELASFLSEKFYALYSDGACRGNPGPGAWAVMAQDQTEKLVFESSGVEISTTNNKMELLAAISGIKILKDLQSQGETDKRRLFLFSDSRYVIDGITKWIPSWKRKGWKKSDGKPPENLDLWKEFDELVKQVESISFFWVKGHNGHPQNEYCDQLANRALDEASF